MPSNLYYNMKTFFDTTFIQGKKLQNRFLVAPMTRVSATPHGIPTVEMQQYYTSFARGGFAGIITEGIYTDDFYSKAYPNQPGLTNNEQLSSWQDIVSSVHQYPTVFIAQLMHAGAISQYSARTKAPSRIIPCGQKMAAYGGGSGQFPVPGELTITEIDNVIEGFVDSAERAYEAGFDGIELHAANGYVLDQFITPYQNLRTDRYGGSVENRLRVIAHIVTEIRTRMPESFIVGLRISEGKVNNLNYRWPGGTTMARAILQQVREWNISYLHVAAEHFGWEHECRYEDGSSLTGLAKEILSCPVIANGQLHNLNLSQLMLDESLTDYFAIGKYALSNPDLPRKVFLGKELTPFDNAMLKDNPSLLSDSKRACYFEMMGKSL